MQKKSGSKSGSNRAPAVLGLKLNEGKRRSAGKPHANASLAYAAALIFSLHSLLNHQLLIRLAFYHNTLRNGADSITIPDYYGFTSSTAAQMSQAKSATSSNEGWKPRQTSPLHARK
jgi:hypothetical protein